MSKKYLALFFVLFLAFTFCPNVSAKYPPVQNERLVINALRQVYNAQIQYQMTFGTGDFGQLYELKMANLIDDALTSGHKYGYYFTLTATSQSATAPPRFVLTAVPRMYRKTGFRSFYIDHRCTLRGADKNGAQATIDDPAIEACTPAIINQNETLVIQGLRTIHAAQATYQSTTGNGTFGTLNALHDAGLINFALSYGFYRRYVFKCLTIAPTANTPASYKISATPLGYGEIGVRSFYIDQTGILRGGDKNGQPADAGDPPIKNPIAE